jgi:hypothetical protein
LKQLDFTPYKSKDDFRGNYKLHDLAEAAGKNLLIQWGIDFEEFGEDRRYSKVWEKGEDKPDLIITYRERDAFLDWKGKHKPKWILNKRAADSYLKWSKKFNLPVLVAFFLFDNENRVADTRFANLNIHSFRECESEAWDKNRVVEFTTELPEFKKHNLIKFCFDITETDTGAI